MLVARIKATIALLLLRWLRAMLGGRAQVVVTPTNYSRSPRQQRRALGKLVAKGMTRGVPGGARTKT